MPICYWLFSPLLRSGQRLLTTRLAMFVSEVVASVKPSIFPSLTIDSPHGTVFSQNRFAEAHKPKPGFSMK
jgi:hypothetical protein